MSEIKKNKVYNGINKNVAVTVIVGLIFVSIFFIFFTSGVSTKGDKVKVSGLLGGEISLSNIETVELREDLPQGLKKEDGIELFGLGYSGKFKSSNFPKVKMYLFTKKKPYMYLKEKGEEGILHIISVRDKEELKEVYNEVKDKVKVASNGV